MRIALSEGRLSKWEQVLEENDFHQLQVLDAYYKIEPWGEARADLREAVMATSIACALSIGDISADDLAQRVERLTKYLGDGSTENPRPASPEAAAATIRAIFGA